MVVVMIRMATQQVLGIVSGEDSAIHDEPHIEGSQITVRYIQRSVEERAASSDGRRPPSPRSGRCLRSSHLLPHTHPDEMRRVEQQRADLDAQAEAMTTLTPPEE
jgi:hypothetical protein